MKIRALNAQDIPAYQALAEHIWRRHYPGIISSEQIEYMLARMYAPEQVEAELVRGVRFLVMDEDSALRGYLAYEPQPEAGSYFLHKLYVDPDHHRRGIAKSLLEAALDQMADARQLELRTHRQNVKAQAFYEKQGFVISHPVDTPFGPYVMEDYQYRKTLYGARAAV
jgi:diamine N-acetyltransferase